MKYFGAWFGDAFAELEAAIKQESEFERAKRLFLDMHSRLHLSDGENEVDILLRDLTRAEWTSMPGKNDETIAWSIWHVARLEDGAICLLVGGKQVLDTEWRARLNAPITDTGNALDDAGIMELGARLDIAALLAYRSAVGARTREIVANLIYADLWRKPSREAVDRLLSEGVVVPETLWLAEYWAKKDVAGLLLMPPTRDTLKHMNSCARFKSTLRAGKKPYLSVN